MQKFILALLLICAVTAKPRAQDFPFGNFKIEEMDLKSYAKDATAHALVLQEYGKTWISSGDGIPLIHERHVKIKIFDSKGFDQGNIEIPLYKGDSESFETVRDIEAITYTNNNNGQIERTLLDSKKIIRENKNKYWDVVKLAMPNLRDGCIIEYKYTIESPFRFNFKTWEFQSEIPKLYSEYEARIPAIYNYKITLRGPLKLDKNTAVADNECFNYHGIKCGCSNMVYAMKDVPAFVEEDYMTASKNFLSAMYFELNDYYNFNTGGTQKVTQEWSDIDYTLKKHEEFGSQMRKTGLFKDKLPLMLAGATTDLDKAKAIYAYLQKTLRSNNIHGIYSDDGVRKAINTHTGSIADINLSLIAALNAAGINTEAVLLSTRSHGVINKLYPVVSDFNYIIAKANIGEQSYLLDASDPMLPFGLLPEHCINDQGRVMSLQKPSYWIDLKASQSRSKTYYIDLTLQNDGKLKGTVTHYSSGYEGYNKRKAIKKFNSMDEYVENMDERLNKLKILKHHIENLDTLSKPLSETYEVEINAYDDLSSGSIAFNPHLFEKLTENPFKLTERTYPVDMGAPTESRFTLVLHMPEQYVIDGEPKKLQLALPNQGGQYITTYGAEGNTYTFSSLIQLKYTVYSSEEYPYLKALFNEIIKAEKADIIFKKKS